MAQLFVLPQIVIAFTYIMVTGANVGSSSLVCELGFILEAKHIQLPCQMSTLSSCLRQSELYYCLISQHLGLFQQCSN